MGWRGTGSAPQSGSLRSQRFARLPWELLVVNLTQQRHSSRQRTAGQHKQSGLTILQARGGGREGGAAIRRALKKYFCRLLKV